MTVAAATLPGVFQTGTHAARPAATAVAKGSLYACTTHFIIYQSDGTVWSNYLALPVSQVSGVPIQIGDGVNAIPTGIAGHFEVPYAGAWSAARMLSDQAEGSAVVDIKKATYAGLPTFASICGAAKPTLSAAQKSQDTALTGWTTAIAAGDWFEVNVDTASGGIKLLTLSLSLTRS